VKVCFLYYEYLHYKDFCATNTMMSGKLVLTILLPSLVAAVWELFLSSRSRLCTCSRIASAAEASN